MRQIYEGIRVDERGLEAVRSLIKSQSGSMVLLPSHRSYMDFLLLSYVFFAYNLPLPFIAAGEDFLNLSFVSKGLREAGAFFIRRSFKEDGLYSALLRAYVQQLVTAGQPLDMTLEPFLDGQIGRAHV